MESTVNEKRKKLTEWAIKASGFESISLEPLEASLSFRRYYRIYTSQGSYILMDASAEKESCDRYVTIAKALRLHGICTPEMMANNTQEGLLLISDFGDLTYLKSLNEHNVEDFYQRALTTLARMQTFTAYEALNLPAFSRGWMQQEWDWHKEWFLQRYLQLPVDRELDAAYELLVQSALAQPYVFMHRDFHSENLMVLPNHEVGVLDFQDAYIGPMTYDLASLLRDAYVDWPTEKVTELVNFFWEQSQVSTRMPQIKPGQFLQWFDWMGLQRHLKVLFTFARKELRDLDLGCRQYMPRTLNYILTVSERYPELMTLHRYYRNQVAPALCAG